MRIRHFLKSFGLPFGLIWAAPFSLFIIPLIQGNVVFWGLPILQFIPWRAYAWQLITQGMMPLWNPLNGMGAPLLANYQLALFYPPGWLIFLANAVGGVPANAWMQTLLIPLHLAFAGSGMALLGKRLGFSVLSQTISGLAFSLGSYFVARAGFTSMVWAGAWLPWMVYFASSIAAPVKQFSGGKGILLPGLIISVAGQFLAGHAQLTWYSMLLLGVWVFIGGLVKGGWKEAGRVMIILALNSIVALGLSAIQILPTAEYLLQSQRSSAVDFETGLTYSFWPWRFLTLLAPGFFGNPADGTFWGYVSYWEDAIYVGVLPLVFALITLGKLWNKNPDDPVRPLIRLGWGMVLVGSIFALGKNTPVFPWLYAHIPTFSLFNAPARWMIWVIFFLTLFAGVGVSAWHRPVGKALRRLKRLTVAAAAITIGAAAAWVTMQTVQITFIQATAFLGIWATGICFLTIFMPRENADPRSLVKWSWLAAGWVALDLVWAGWAGQPVISAEIFGNEGQAPIANSTSGRVFLAEDDEYALKFRRLFRFSDYQAIEDSARLKSIALPNMNLIANPPFSYVNNFDPFVPERYARWFDYINQLSGKERNSFLQFMSVGVSLLRDTTSAEGVLAHPVAGDSRIRWMSCARWVAGETQAFESVTGELSKSIDSQGLLFLEGNEPNLVCDRQEVITIQAEIDQANFIKLNLNRSSDGYLFIADTWFPGWTAEIDHQKVEIYHANYLFRAVKVPPGEHTIAFRYSPTTFYIGAGISIATLVFMILWCLSLRVRVKYSINMH